ncbi:MAG TPA: phosphoribosylamine--glycine ligase [Bacteroidetes bacterium]|nr:phosphoribosylamine--glycine ligase [Bacteroidota bacterium]
MRIMLIGRWGKTHALAKALAASRDVELYSLMDKKNTGIASLSAHYELGNIKDLSVIQKFVEKHRIDMLFVVPEMSLARGITDYFNEKGIPAVGPSEFCTKLEGDKGFVRNLMKENHIDHYPDFHVFSDKKEAVEFIRNYSRPFAVKPSGITEGDGVKVMGIQLINKQEAMDYVEQIFDRSIGGMASVIIEEKIEGEEYTIQLFCDGKTVVPMPVVRDYKLLEEGESGLNTPGMGSVSYPNHLLPSLSKNNFDESVVIMERILDVLKEKYGEKYNGFLSGQFMLTEQGIRVVEINVRPGDSEILNIIPILQTDFMDICRAMANEKLDEIKISFAEKSTVCIYAVPEGFPTPSGKVQIHIDRKRFEKPGIHLFQSCFEAGESLYEPSPRLFAVTGTGDSLEEAREKCLEGLSGIRGKNIFYRKDIGTRDLAERYMKKYDLPGV